MDGRHDIIIPPDGVHVDTIWHEWWQPDIVVST